VSQTSWRVPEPTPSYRAGSGEPLLLIHPFLLSHDVWADVAPALAEEYDVVAATLPGHWGGPHLRRRDTSLAAFADGLEELMDDLGWETAHLAGNSIGGWLALELARRGRARSVTAIAPGGGWRRFSWAQLQVGLKFLLLAPVLVVGHLLGDGARRLPRALLTPLQRVVSAHPDRMTGAQVDAMVRATTHCSAFLPYFWSDLRVGGARHLSMISVPTRIVLCERDWLLPPERYGAMFRDQLRDAEVVELPDVGHVPMYDDPERVVELVAEHARRAGREAA
jgi:pimeloyl-ACP methyl ester carboxylesterase